MKTVTRDQARVTHVRGPGMPLLRATMLAALSEDRQQRLMEGLGPAARAFMAAAARESDWIPVPVVLELEGAFLAMSNLDPFPAHGGLMAQRMLEGRLEGLFLNWMGHRAFLRILPLVWNRFNRGGVLDLEYLDDGGAALTLWADYPTPIFVARVIPAFAEESLKRLGAKGLKLEYQAPGPEDPSWKHRYLVTWQS